MPFPSMRCEAVYGAMRGDASVCGDASLCGAAGEGDQAVQDVDVGARLDGVGEAAAAPDFWGDDRPRHVENMPGEFVGHTDLLAGGLGVVPRVDQEFDRENTEGERGGHLLRPYLGGAVEPAAVPLLQRTPGRRPGRAPQGGPSRLEEL